MMRENEKNCTDFEISVSSDNIFTQHGNAMLSDDALFAFHLDESVLELLKGELCDKVNSLCVFELAPESSLSAFSKNLEELILYIIYHNENNNIVDDNLWIVCKDTTMYNNAVEIVNKCQKKITKNAGALFPTPESSCFNSSLPGFNFCVCVSKHQAYFAETEEPTTEEKITFYPKSKKDEIDFEDGWYYEEVWEEEASSSGSGSSGGTPVKVFTGWNRIDTIETHTVAMRGMYSQLMGNLTTSINIDNQTLTIVRTVNSEIYGKTQP